LECRANPNAQEETTGWTPLHFAVSKAHYPLILQLLHHDGTCVNQGDKCDWPPLLEACSRLDARSTSLLVNGGADLGFRNQHQFDVLKAVDTSKKDLAAKRWMSCLVVSNGFRFEESTVQLSQEDRDTLERERNFFQTRVVPPSNPPFFVPDHLAPRCHRCKVLFSVSLRRYHCRSCGLVLCGNCFTWRGTNLVALDERSHARTSASSSGGRRPNARLVEQQEVVGNLARNAAADKSDTTCASVTGDPDASRPSGEASGSGRRGGSAAEAHAASSSPQAVKEDSFEEPPLAEELPAVGLPMSVVCLSSAMASDSSAVQRGGHRRSQGCVGTGDNSESGVGHGGTRMMRLCASCSTFFEAGVGETYSTLIQRKGC